MTASPVVPSDHGLRTAFPATLLIALAALAAVAPLATDAYLPAFAQMADDLGVSASSVQLTMTTFLVGIALGQLGIGVLSDRVGRRPLLLWGSVLAPVVAPILGGVLVEPIGWRGILGVVAAFTGLLVVMVVLWVPESLPAEQRHDGGLRMLLDGSRELARDHVLVRLLLINALSFGLLMAYLSAAPFVLRNVLGMGTVVYTAVFGLCGATVTVTIAVAASLVRRFSQARQVRVGLIAGLVVDMVFAGVCLMWLREPVTGPERMPLLVAVVALFLAHVACLGLAMGNAPALALDRTGRWAGTGSALLGFLQFVVGGLVSPLVGLTGEASGVAFGVVIVAVGAAANVLAVFGLRERGEKQRLAAEEAERRQRRLGQ